MEFTKSERIMIADNIMKLLESDLVNINLNMYTPSYYNNTFSPKYANPCKVIEFKSADDFYNIFLNSCEMNLSTFLKYCWNFNNTEEIIPKIEKALDLLAKKYNTEEIRTKQFNEFKNQFVNNSSKLALGISYSFKNNCVNSLIRDKEEIKFPIKNIDLKLAKLATVFNSKPNITDSTCFQHTIFEMNSFNTIISIQQEQLNNLYLVKQYMHIDELAKHGKNNEYDKVISRFISKFELIFKKQFTLDPNTPYTITYDQITPSQWGYNKNIALELNRDIPTDYELEVTNLYKVIIAFHFQNPLTYAQKGVFNKLIKNYLAGHNIMLISNEFNDRGKLTYLADQYKISFMANSYKEIGENKLVNFIPSMH